MSMNMSVYVGPYLRVDGCPRELVEKHERLVCNGRGELFTDDPKGVMYLIPNFHIRGVTRQMSFSRDSEMPVVEIEYMDRENEMEAFRLEVAPFVDEVESVGADVETRWGVVCCYM